MYIPKHFNEGETEVLHALMRAHPLGLHRHARAGRLIGRTYSAAAAHRCGGRRLISGPRRPRQSAGKNRRSIT